LSDTGVGIEDEEKDKIFDRFYRIDKSRNRNKGGSGLGLSIVDSVVKSYGGRIDVQSRLGEGTSFIVRLPLSLST
jgi:signal transduction histidine kinase